MSVSAVPLLGSAPSPVRLIDTAVAVPALLSHIRPALVLSEDDTRALVAAADQQGVHGAGCFLAGLSRPRPGVNPAPVAPGSPPERPPPLCSRACSRCAASVRVATG